MGVWIIEKEIEFIMLSLKCDQSYFMWIPFIFNSETQIGT